MRKATLLVLPSLVVAGALFAAEVFDIKPNVILPPAYPQLLQQARTNHDRYRQLLWLYNRLTNQRWTLRRAPTHDRFHILPRDELLLPLPKMLRRRILDRLPKDLTQLFARHRIRYSDRAYQLMRWEELTKYDRPDGKDKLPKGKKGDEGWRWDISDDIRLILRGSQDIDISYGFDIVDQNLKEGTHVRRVGVQRGFKLAQNLNIKLVGRVGPKVSISIDHNSRRKENLYDIKYEGARDELIKEIKAGNIDLTIPGSKYVVYSGGSKSAFGVKGVLENRSFKLQAVISLTKGVSETRTFKGQKKEQKITVRDIAYVKRVYFLLPDRSIDQNSLRVYRTTTETNQAVQISGGLYKLQLAGKDFSVNFQNGNLDLARALSKNENLLVTYTVGGSQVPGSFNPYGSFQSHELVDDGGTRFLYLKRVGYYSRFERKGIYRLGYGNVDVTRGFEFYIVNTADGARSDTVQFNPSDYRLDAQTGVLEFYLLEPFQDKPGVGEALYHSANDPQTSDSVYSLYFAFMHRLDTFQLRFNIIPGSERITVNGARMQRDVDYRLDYMTGTLSFISTINENDTIEASYEYKPFSSSLQRTLFGLRADYHLLPGLDLGSTLVYSGGQKPTGAPTPLNPPDAQLVFDLDSRIDFMKLLGIEDKNWVLKLEGEWAHSIHDRNTVGSALLADMEGDSIGYAITRSENSWLPGSPSPNIPGLSQSTRGRLLYRDYREYGLNDYFSLKSYNWSLPGEQIYDYSRKPGPYTVQGGRNESTVELVENSLVLEYDFSQTGSDWVSVVCSVGNSGGIDLSRINTLLVSLKHQRFTGTDGSGHAQYADETGQSVYLYFELGNLNEDSDGDQVFDREDTLSSGGFRFNPAGVDATWVGGGRRNAGNGQLDSEDLNRDNVFQTNESSVLFPGTELTGSDSLEIPSTTDWQEYSLPIRNLSLEQISILEKVSAVRITVRKGLVGERGRLIIDRAYFKGSRWENLKIDNDTVRTAPEFSATIISTKENLEYKNNRIYKEYPDMFEDLHGRMSKAEEERQNEKALQIKYDLSNQSRVSNQFGTIGTVTKIYNANMDFTYYKKLNLFLYIKEKAGHTNEFFLIRLGNAEDRYYEWRLPMADLATAADASAAGGKKWHKLELHLNPEQSDQRLKLYVNGRDYGKATLTSKRPNLREVNRASFGIDVTGSSQSSSKGEIWINEAHLFDDRTRSGSAWSVRGEFASKKKHLVHLFGFPLLGPFSLKFDYSEIGFGFRSLGQGGADETALSFNTSGKLNLFQYLTASFQLVDEKKHSDTDQDMLPLALQYGSTNFTYKHSLSYKDPRGFFPHISHSYSRNLNRQVSHRIEVGDLTSTNDVIVDSIKQQFSESAAFLVSGKLPLGFSHSYDISDSYYLTDISIKTNNIANSWFTNNTTQTYETFAKRETFALQFTQKELFSVKRSLFKLSGSLFRQQENFNRFNNRDGMRTEFQRLEKQGVLSSFSGRMDELFSGIGNVSNATDGTNQNSVEEGFKISSSLKNLGFLSLDYNFSRSTKDSNFVESTNLLLLKNNATTARSSLKATLNFPKFVIRTLDASLDRDFSFTQVSGNDSMDTIWNQFQDDFFSLPFNFLGKRENDVLFVDRLSGSEGNSYVKLNNKFTFRGKLDFGKTLFHDLLPEDYSFSLAQNTSRNLSSIAQSRTWNVTINKAFPLGKLGFWIFDNSKKGGSLVQDLNVKFTMGRKYDYNAKTIEDSLGTAVAFALRWSKENALSINYTLSHSHAFQSLFESDPGYEYMGLGPDSGAGSGDSFADREEQTDGSPPAYTEIPALIKYGHTIGFNLSFPTRHNGTWNLFGWKIPIDTHWKHENELSLNLTSSQYERTRAGLYSFTELFDRVFYLKLRHAIDYDFSKSWNGVFYLLVVLEQWKLTRPDNQGQELLIEEFPMSWGFELGLKMKIRF